MKFLWTWEITSSTFDNINSPSRMQSVLRKRRGTTNPQFLSANKTSSTYNICGEPKLDVIMHKLITEQKTYVAVIRTLEETSINYFSRVVLSNIVLPYFTLWRINDSSWCQQNIQEKWRHIFRELYLLCRFGIWI